MSSLRYALAVLATLPVLMFGCSTIPEGRPLTLGQAAKPAWSMKHTDDDMTVAVSPAGKTLRFAGSAGIVIGAGVDAAVNEKYRKRLHEILGDYDTGQALDDAVAERLDGVLGKEFKRVAALTSTAGVDSKRDADALRYEGLAKDGFDMLLELRASHGVYGRKGVMVAKLDGKLLLLPEGKKLWDREIVVCTDPVLACVKPGSASGGLVSGLTDPHLFVQGDFLDQWAADGGESLRARYQTTIDALVSTLVCSLGLAEEAEGEYYLGKMALNDKDPEEAARRFAKALNLNNEWPDAHNAMAVTKARQDDLAEAIAVASRITETWPEYGPAYLNLAWWFAIDKGDASTARGFYKRAIELGMEPVAAIEKALEE